MVNHLRTISKKKLSQSILANSLILLGMVLIFAAFTLSQFAWSTSSPVKAQSLPTPAPQMDTPNSITVGQIDQLKIIPGDINQGQWDLAVDQAVFLKKGGQLDKPGNIIIYGHDTDPVFAKLFNINNTNLITLSSTSGKSYMYKIDQIKTVWPTDVSILNQPADENELTIFTCVGLFDAQRLVIVAHQI